MKYSITFDFEILQNYCGYCVKLIVPDCHLTDKPCTKENCPELSEIMDSVEEDHEKDKDNG